MEHVEGVDMTATEEGGKGTEAALMNWYRRLSHPPLKTVVELAQNGASWIVITDLPVKIPGLDAWLRASWGIGRLASHGKTSGGRVSGTGPYRHSRTRANCVDQRDSICVRRRG